MSVGGDGGAGRGLGSGNVPPDGWGYRQPGPQSGEGRARPAATGSWASRTVPPQPRQPGETAPDRSTYYPILGRVDIKYYAPSAARRLRSRAGVAQVLYRDGEIIRVVEPTQRLTAGEILATRCTHALYVDVLPHDLVLQGPLACRGGAHDFHAIVRLTCQVVLPGEVAKQNVKDVGERLKRAVFDRMWRVSHDHGVNDDIRARQTILEQLAWNEIDPLFELSKVTLDLRLDDDVRDILRAELNRGYFEDLVNKGPTAVAAWHLNRHQDDAAGAMGLLHEHQRRQVEIHRDEELHLLNSNIVRPEVLEARALERLERLEPQELRPPSDPGLPRLPHTTVQQLSYEEQEHAIEAEVIEPREHRSDP